MARYGESDNFKSEEKQKRFYDQLAAYLNGDISAKDFLVSTGTYGEEIYKDADGFYENFARGIANDALEHGLITEAPQEESFYPSEGEFFQDTPRQEARQYPNLPMNEDGTIKPVIDRSALRNEPTAQETRPTQEQIANTQAQSDRLRGANSVDNTKGANTEGEYWRVAPKEEVKAQPSHTEKQERVIPDYMQSEDFQKGLDESLEMGGKTEAELKGENDRAKRLDNALLSDYDDSSLLLQEYAKGLISPEEEERRARRARAAEGWAHIGNIISGFAGLANTKKGSPNIDLADVKDAKVDEWRDKVRNNRLAYQKARLQMDREKSAEYWRAQKFEETKRKNDADIKRIEANIKKAQSEADYKEAMTELQNKRIELEEEKVELTKARTKAVVDGNARQERYYDERIRLVDAQIKATDALAKQRNANADKVANGGSSGSGTSKPVVVGGKEVANPRKLNQSDVNRHIKAVAKNNGIAMTKRGNGIDEKDKTIDELGEEIAGNPKALQELRDRLANGESGGNTTTQSESNTQSKKIYKDRNNNNQGKKIRKI